MYFFINLGAVGGEKTPNFTEYRVVVATLRDVSGAVGGGDKIMIMKKEHRNESLLEACPLRWVAGWGRQTATFSVAR